MSTRGNKIIKDCLSNNVEIVSTVEGERLKILLRKTNTGDPFRMAEALERDGFELVGFEPLV